MRILYVSFIVVIIDQLSKLCIKGFSIPFLGINIKGVALNTSIRVIDNIFSITFIENPGMAFGIQFGGKLALSLFTVFATGLIVYFIYKNRKESFYIKFSLALILGGAIGNLIDRIFYGVLFKYDSLFFGKVVDFFHFNIPDFKIFGKAFTSWPIFNVADIAVTVGFLLILIGYRKIFHKQNAEEPKPSGTDVNPVLSTDYQNSDLKSFNPEHRYSDNTEKLSS